VRVLIAVGVACTAVLVVVFAGSASNPPGATDGNRRLAGRPTHTIAANGVRLSVPSDWAGVKPAVDAPVVDPRTLLVVGTPGVRALHVHCPGVASYHVPALGAVVVVIGWAPGIAAGGPLPQGRAALDTLTKVHRPMFDCYAGRGAAAGLRLAGRDYQVNVMVGSRATAKRVAEALTVGRSFGLESH
jgi:hypothetical protein